MDPMFPILCFRTVTVLDLVSCSPHMAMYGILRSSACLILELVVDVSLSISDLIPCASSFLWTFRAYETQLAVIGSTIACVGASQVGRFPSHCSSSIAKNRSIAPSRALWIIMV